MISNIDDFDFLVDDKEEQVEQKVKEKLGISFNQLKDKLFISIKENVEMLALDIPNIAPNEDYSKIIEDNDEIADFLKTEVCQYEKWTLNLICISDVNENLVQFKFRCNAVDDGNSFFGFVFTDKNGNIRHAFSNYDYLVC